MTGEEKLNSLRERIDETDKALVKLFIDRMDICREVAEAKKEAGLPVENRKREEAVLEKISKEAGSENAEYVRALYEKIFELSKEEQRKI